MAMARIGASLHDRGVLPAIGPVSNEDLDALQTVSGLIGIVEKSPRGRSSMTRSVSPDLITTDGSGAELQRLDLAEEGHESFGDSTRRVISMIGSVSPDLGIKGSSEPELQRLNPAEGHESSEDGSLSAMSPNLATTNSSDTERQQLNSTEELRGNFEEFSTGVELGLDAPGPILMTDVPRRTWQQELNVFENLDLPRDHRSAKHETVLLKAENDVNYECLAHINKKSSTTYQRNTTSRKRNPRPGIISSPKQLSTQTNAKVETRNIGKLRHYALLPPSLEMQGRLLVSDMLQSNRQDGRYKRDAE
ncbi:hypothetical protein J4E91_006561 [Alternaria rosae]|nr:hypothetical protein J4E91_006561 [Alternaria rosae]